MRVSGKTWWLGGAATLMVCLLLTSTVWLKALGEYLVQAEAPVRADAVVVLGGDWTGERVLLGGDLVKRGYAPVALVSGPMELYGTNEAELSIQFAVRHGYPASYFQALVFRALSTRDESILFRQELDRRHAHVIDLVTSNFHTRRAGRIFRKGLGPGIEVHTVAAPFAYYDPETWWTERESRKTFLFEFMKTFAEFVGL